MASILWIEKAYLDEGAVKIVAMSAKCVAILASLWGDAPFSISRKWGYNASVFYGCAVWKHRKRVKRDGLLL